VKWFISVTAQGLTTLATEDTDIHGILKRKGKGFSRMTRMDEDFENHQ
jgi:hypothetical protein